ncbi:MAG TPA: hypothetical protein PLK63_12870 [Catalimonadaceae bacterium]|nr:hypothetical protein [Catalimonadaceae bacterium]
MDRTYVFNLETENMRTFSLVSHTAKLLLVLFLSLGSFHSRSQNNLKYKADLYGVSSSVFTGNINFMDYDVLPNNSRYAYVQMWNIQPDATTNGYFVPFDIQAERVWVAASDLAPGQRITMTPVQSVSPTANFSVISELEAGKSYTFRMRVLGLATTKGVVMKTNARPTNFLSVTNSTVNNEVPAGTAVTVTATLDKVRGTDENFYLKYSMDPPSDPLREFSYLPLQFSGANDVTGEAIIPAPAVSGTVYYYVVSSTFDIPQELSDPNFTDGDLLNLNTFPANGNPILSYAVKPGVVFRFRASGLTVHPTGIYLAGSFNGFNPTARKMKDMGGNIYLAELDLPAGSAVTYKFLNGPAWENVPTACGVNDGGGNINRSFTPSSSIDSTDLVCFSTCTDCFGAPQNITFRVNMTGQTVSPAGVFLQGSFNNFSATANPMTSVGNGVYELTLGINYIPNGFMQYRYLNGSVAEAVPATCSVPVSGNNYRQSALQPQASTLPTVCFSACDNACGTSQVAFRVNMTNQTVSPLGVYLAGSFNGFSTTANPMTSVGAGIYEAIVTIPRGDTVIYKFVNGSSFELVPATCGIDDGNGNLNRRAIAGNQATTILSTFCFGKCDGNCPPIQFFNVTFQVRTVGTVVSPQGIFLAGNFNNFSPTATPMQNPTGNFYTVTVSVPNNQPILYRFVNGNTFETIPAVCGEDNGAGAFNRKVSAPTATTSIPAVCFGRCDNICTNAPNRDVTFRVNMAGLNVSPFGVSLTGDFVNFTTLEMNNVGNNIYELVYSLPEGLSFKYRYVNGLSGETVPAACGTLDGGTYYRTVTVQNTATITPTVCYGTCGNTCAPSTNVNVTFRVKMTGQTVSPAGVKLAGSFNGFSQTANPMTSVGNDVYEAVVSLPSNSPVTYKFVNGTAWENVPTSCGVSDGGGNINRSFSVPGVNATISTVCFSACDAACSPVTLVPITFRVNMVNETPSANGIKLAGSFNAFSPTANVMTNVYGSVYETTIQVAAGSVITYKFVNGTTYESGLENFGCGVNDGGGNFNRQYSVPDAADTLPTFCFNRCENCAFRTVRFLVNMQGQTIDPTGVKIAASFNNYSLTTNSLTLQSGTTYGTDISLTPGEPVTYRFVNGSTIEAVPQACGQGNPLQRAFTPSAGSTTIVMPEVCFSSCINCSTAVTIPVTFRVNMTGQTVSPDGVKLAGSFNGYSTVANPMTAMGNNLYETTIQLPASDTVTYKFVNGTVFETGLEAGGCGFNDGSGNFNRRLINGSTTTIVPEVCFGKCDLSCIPQIFTGTFRVNMTGQTVSAQGVKLATSFNDLQPVPMTSIGNNRYEAIITIPPNAGFGYAFMNGLNMENVPLACGVASGGPVLRSGAAGTSSTIFPEVCYSACDLACTTVSVDKEQLSRAFTVYPNPTSGKLFIKGWNGQTDQIRIFHLDGRSVGAEQVMLHDGIIEIDSENLPTGLYLLSAEGNVRLFEVIK